MLDFIQRWKEGSGEVEKICVYCQKIFSTSHICDSNDKNVISNNLIKRLEKITMREKIEIKLKDTEKQFTELETKRQELTKRRDEMNNIINQAVEEQVRLQGEFRVLKALLDDHDKEKGDNNGGQSTFTTTAPVNRVAKE